MCWITYKQPKPLVAEKDVKVYKVFLSKNICRPHWWQFWKKTIYMSWFWNFPYIQGKKNQTVHLYLEHDTISVERYYINQGYHSYMPGYVEIYGGNCRTVECIIPKGTKYYVNESGEVVSENIIIKGIVK